HAAPLGRVSGWVGKFGAKARTPLFFVAVEKLAGIEGAEGVTANPLGIFKDLAQLQFERQVRANINSAKGIRIFAIKRFTILAVIASLETNVISSGLVGGGSRSDRALAHQGKSVWPIKNRSHSRAAPRPSLKAHTTRLWPRRQSPAAKTPF